MKYEQLPHDDIVEKGIFCVLLDAPERFSEVVDMLVPSDFYNASNQQIWQAMTDLFREGKEIDFPSIRLQLKQTDVDPKPALEALANAMNEETKDYHLIDFIKDVKNKSLLRQIIRASKSHAYSGQLEGAKASELLTTIEKDIVNIIDKTTDAKPTDAKGIIEEVQADIEQGMKDGWKGFQTGFAKLDESTGGFIPSQVWIIGAYTGVGKTFFILQMLLNVLEQGGRVALFSTEMDRKLNMLRMIGNLAGLGTIQMMKNKLVDHEVEKMRQAQKKLSDYGDRLMIYDNIYTTEEIRMKAKKLQLSGGLNVVAVDYIQNLRGGENIYERMSEASVGLFRVAQELKVTMLLGSQVSQDAAGWKSKEAIEFKGAGEIAAVSDVALWIKKTEGDGSEREIMLRKIRHGAPGKTYAKLSFPSGRVIDTDTQGVAKEEHDIKDQL